MSIANLLNDFRRWLDGEEAAAVVTDQQPRPRREWEEFLVGVAREIEVVMQREMFTPPGGPTYIPREYLVFLSKEDDANWQGDKRKGLESGLYHVLSERAKELVNDQEMQTKSFAIELRVDGTLDKGKYRVQPVWDSSAPKTEVRPRAPKPPPRAPAEVETVEDEATVVRPRAPLFTIEYARPGEPLRTFKCYQPKISIGRGSKDFPVDLKLEGDLEISRKQAVIQRAADGSFSVGCEGRNPIEANGKEVPQGERRPVAPGDALKLGTYELRVVAPSSDETITV